MTTDSRDQLNRPIAPAGRGSSPPLPATVDQTLALLDGIIRYCVQGCLPTTSACIEGACGPWRLERAAVDHLERQRLDATAGGVEESPGVGS